MASSFLAYIDEAGCEGFAFEKGSSRWFVLSAVVTRQEEDLKTVKIVDEVRKVLNKPPKKPLHFRRLKHDHRVYFVGEISRQRLRIVTVCVHKPSLIEQEKFHERYRLYYYVTRYLLERVSWLCRDNRKGDDKNDGTVKLFFSNRAGMSYEELRDYLRNLRSRTDQLDVRIDWNVIKEESVRAYSPGKRMGLQIADTVASAFFKALEPNQFGYTESRYAEMLIPLIYKHKGKSLGYGLKLWPREVGEFVETKEEFKWIRSNLK